MESAEAITERDHAVELSVLDESGPPLAHGSGRDAISEEIVPLLTQPEKPRINIFSVSRSRRKPREQVIKLHETEISPFSQFILWVWNGSRYSGLLCMAMSSVIYFVMEILSTVFSVQPIPLNETAFSRCTVILILSYLWLRKSGQPLFGPSNVRLILVMRAMVGYLSLLSFIYCIQSLPLSQALVLSFTTPVLASIAARFILHEKLKISDIGGLACSFFGVLFIFRQSLGTHAGLSKSGKGNTRRSHHFFAALVGFCSAITGGISYTLIRAAAKASEQPLTTLFSFGLLACPAACICMFSLEEIVLPDFYSFFLMLTLGVLAFFAEVLLARGLQLEKTSKVANVQYIEIALSQLWGVASSSLSPAFGRIVGCLLILISISFTLYLGPDKETE